MRTSGTSGAAAGGDRNFGGCTAVGAGDALSRQFGRACQVGGAKVGIGANVREHVTQRSYEMSSSDEFREARDPDFASPDPSGKGKRKIMGEEGSAGESAGQEQLHRTGDSNNFAASSGKGKRKLHVEDDEDLQTGLHRVPAFYPTPADHRKSRSKVALRNKRHRLPDDTGPGPSANTIGISKSPMPTGEDRTSRRIARVRYERGPGSMSIDTSAAPAEGATETSARNREETNDHAVSPVQAMVTRPHRPARRRDSQATFGDDEGVGEIPALADDSSTGRSPATNPHSHFPPDPIRRGIERRGFSPSTSFVGTSYRIRGNPSLAGSAEVDTDSSGVRAQGRRHRTLERTGTGSGSGSGFVPRGPFPSSPRLSIDRYGIRRLRRQHRSYPLGEANQDVFEGTVTPGMTQGGQFPSGAPQAPINLDEIESPRGASRSIIELEDEPSGSSQQLAEDERMARELQAELNGQLSEASVESYDAQLARVWQAHENERMRLVTRPFLNIMDEYARQRTDRASWRRHRDSASWRRHGLGASLADDAAGSSVRLPAHLSMEMRIDVLAALESAFQDRPLPLNLRLASLDRDFNENDYEMLLALDENNRMNGASAEHIQQLPVTVVQPTDVSDEACAVCLEVPVVGDHIRRLPCMHSFHRQCIDKWLQTQAVCPVCKAHI